MRASQFHRYRNLIRNIANWRDLLIMKFNRRHPDHSHFTTRRGIKIDVPRELQHDFKQIFMDECYEVGPLPESATVIDIGANTGFFSLFAAHRYPGARIIACEPIEENLLHLRRQISINPTARIECLPVAIDGQTGRATIRLEGDGVITTTASLALHQDYHAKSVEVETLSLADLLMRHHVAHCDLLKLDCEGAEYAILYEAPPETLARIDRIAMEIHEVIGAVGNHTALAMIHFLQERNYRVERRQNIVRAWRKTTN